MKIFTEIYADPIASGSYSYCHCDRFGLQSFAIILIKRVYKVLETDDLDELNSTDEEI
jgi:multicomponent Na+:H+ antiporter subunit C